MSQNSFKYYLYFKKKKILLVSYIRTISPIFFKKTLINYNGRFKNKRKVFFIHNNISYKNLFLCKKPKPKPIISKKKKK